MRFRESRKTQETKLLAQEVDSSVIGMTLLPKAKFDGEVGREVSGKMVGRAEVL